MKSIGECNSKYKSAQEEMYRKIAEYGHFLAVNFQVIPKWECNVMNDYIIFLHSNPNTESIYYREENTDKLG